MWASRLTKFAVVLYGFVITFAVCITCYEAINALKKIQTDVDAMKNELKDVKRQQDENYARMKEILSKFESKKTPLTDEDLQKIEDMIGKFIPPINRRSSQQYIRLGSLQVEIDCLEKDISEYDQYIEEGKKELEKRPQTDKTSKEESNAIKAAEETCQQLRANLERQKKEINEIINTDEPQPPPLPKSILIELANHEIYVTDPFNQKHKEDMPTIMVLLTECTAEIKEIIIKPTANNFDATLIEKLAKKNNITLKHAQK